MGQSNDREWMARLAQEGCRFSTYFFTIKNHYTDPDIGRLGLYTAPAYLISGGITRPYTESMFEDDAQPRTNSVDNPNVPPYPNPSGTGN